MINILLLAGLGAAALYAFGGSGKKSTSATTFARGHLLDEGLRLDDSNGDAVASFVFDPQTQTMQQWAAGVADWLYTNLRQSKLTIDIYQSAQPLKDALKIELSKLANRTPPPSWKLDLINLHR